MIRLISTRFVPVALNLYKIRAAKGPGGDFFRSVYRQNTQYQGLWLVSPSGRILDSHQETRFQGDWAKKVLTDLEAGGRAFGELEPRRVAVVDPLPFRGTGVREDGSVTLALTDKVIAVKDLSRELPRTAMGRIYLDSLPLSAEEWPTLAPPDEVRPGARWAIPEPVARQFYRVLNRNDISFRSPDEVTAVRLTGTVASVQGGIARLTFAGQIAGVHDGGTRGAWKGKQQSSESRLVGGVGTYDIRAKAMRSLVLVWDGHFRNYPPYDVPVRHGIVVEWRAGR